MTIKLIALDLDGTLFGDDLLISPRTRRAIRAAQERGVVVTVATGRMFRSARQVAADLNISGPIICYQGALVADSGTAEVLYHATLPPELSLQIIEDCGRQGLHLNLYLHDNLYVAQRTPEAEFYSRINMDLPLNVVGDLSAWLRSQTDPGLTKIVIVTDATSTDAVLAQFRQRYGASAQVTKSHARFTEFTNAACSKGRALEFLANHHGVHRSAVMAIGDGLNDLDMVAWAGCGVAMSASPPEVLRAARFVTGSIADDGVAAVIESHVLAVTPGEG